jgi:hypothetical protein
MSFPEMNDLIRRAKEGDRSALDGLIARFRRYPYRLAWDQLASDIHHRVDPSDVVQESCLSFTVIFTHFAVPKQPNCRPGLSGWCSAMYPIPFANTFMWQNGPLEVNSRLPAQVTPAARWNSDFRLINRLPASALDTWNRCSCWKTPWTACRGIKAKPFGCDTSKAGHWRGWPSTSIVQRWPWRAS